MKNRAKFLLRIWVSCERPRSGVIFQLKQKIKLEYKKYLRSAKLKICNLLTSNLDWKKVVNSDKIDDSSSTSSPISHAAWCKYLDQIFNTINHFFMLLL